MVKDSFQMLRDSPLPLSKHFKLREFLVSETADRTGISNHPHTYKRFAVCLKNLCTLVEKLEIIRAAIGNKPIYITSGIRSVALNQQVNGEYNSKHLIGAAVDFTADDFDDLCEAVEFCYAGNPEVYFYRGDSNYIHLELEKNYFKDDRC